MKKVALSLAALALLGAGAFAQTAPSNLKLGGYLDVGTETVVKSDSGTSTTIKGNDSGIGGGSYETSGAFKLSDAAGVNFKFRFNDLSAGTKVGTELENGYVWFKVPGAEVVKVLAGNIDGSGWGGKDDNGANSSGGEGVQVQISPVDGLTVGGQYHGLATATSVAPIYSFGGAYSIDKVAAFAVGAKTAANKDNAIAVDSAYVTTSVTAVDKLTLKGGYNLGSLSAATNIGTNILDVTVGYAVTDALSATLNTYIYTYGSDLKAYNKSKGTFSDAVNLSYKLAPSVSYTVSPVVSAGVGATYQSGASGKGVGTATAVFNNVTFLEVNPNATFTVDANTKVVVNYKYDAFSGDDLSGAKDLTWQTFSVDYRYSF